ncbi:MAG: NADH:ubiquinone reductase (Na(+)-transporting) subunit B [Bacteroidetes bacterium]|nr:NADH:ubiquinone reductase (Na(+)-transporting) subunit B [Bacteroidota bacterium]
MLADRLKEKVSKALLDLAENIKPKVAKGKPFHFLHSFYDGNYTLMFQPGTTTKGKVHLRDGIDSKRTMFTVVIAMIPCLLFGMWNAGHQHFAPIIEIAERLISAISLDSLSQEVLWAKINALAAVDGGLADAMYEAGRRNLEGPELLSYIMPSIENIADAGFFSKFIYGAIRVLPIVVVSYVTGLGIEFAVAQMKGHPIAEGFLVSGMLIPLIMPVTIPLWMVVVATAFAVIIGKEIFGGTGMNILNVALTARVFIFFAYPTSISGDKVWIQDLVDGASGATALAQAFEGGVAGLSWSWFDMFIGSIPGSIGETSTLMILIGAAILIATGIGSWKIMLSVMLGAGVMGILLNIVGGMEGVENQFLAVPFYYHWVMGGLAFGAVYMATDPVTASQTEKGKWIYGFLIGFFAILVRVLNPAYPEGIMLAILFFNVFAPLIDHYIVEANIKRRLAYAKG